MLQFIVTTTNKFDPTNLLRPTALNRGQIICTQYRSVRPAFCFLRLLYTLCNPSMLLSSGRAYAWCDLLVSADKTLTHVRNARECIISVIKDLRRAVPAVRRRRASLTCVHFRRLLINGRYINSTCISTGFSGVYVMWVCVCVVFVSVWVWLRVCWNDSHREHILLYSHAWKILPLNTFTEKERIRFESERDWHLCI